MLLSRDRIEPLIPHAGAMCLLDFVTHWDESGIRCVSRTHLDAGNPLRVEGRLPILCGIEYAAQAMAVHGGLIRDQSEKPRAGYLASVRDVACRRDRLDDAGSELVVEAQRVMGEEGHVIYEFRLMVDGEEAMSGRAAVVLEVPSLKTQVPRP